MLVRRFSETRRPHPLAINQPAIEGIREEREALRPIRKMADMILDTSEYTVHGLRDYIKEHYDVRTQAAPLVLGVMSFGYKYGVPSEADLVFDVRFLPNPNFVPRLKPLTGNDAPVVRYMRQQEDTDAFLARLRSFLDYVLPRYVREGKSYLTVGIGCTGGRHRSVMIANELAAHLTARASRSASATATWQGEVVIGIVVVTHGQLAAELVNAARQIVGEIPRIAAVSIGWADDMTAAREAIERALGEVGGEGALVLTDMFGGTPTNVILPFLSDARGDRHRREPAHADQAHLPARGRPGGDRARGPRPGQGRDLRGQRSAGEEARGDRARSHDPQPARAARPRRRALRAHRQPLPLARHAHGRDAQAMDGKSILGILLLAASQGSRWRSRRR